MRWCGEDDAIGGEGAIGGARGVGEGFGGGSGEDGALDAAMEVWRCKCGGWDEDWKGSGGFEGAFGEERFFDAEKRGSPPTLGFTFECYKGVFGGAGEILGGEEGEDYLGAEGDAEVRLGCGKETRDACA